MVYDVHFLYFILCVSFSKIYDFIKGIVDAYT